VNGSYIFRRLADFIVITVANTQVTPELKAYVHKLVGAFGIGLEHPPAAISSGTGQLTHEALAKRAQAAAEDPAFQRLKNQFASDFDFRLDLYTAYILRSIKQLSLQFSWCSTITFIDGKTEEVD